MKRPHDMHEMIAISPEMLEKSPNGLVQDYLIKQNWIVAHEQASIGALIRDHERNLKIKDQRLPADVLTASMTKEQEEEAFKIYLREKLGFTDAQIRALDGYSQEVTGLSLALLNKGVKGFPDMMFRAGERDTNIDISEGGRVIQTQDLHFDYLNVNTGLKANMGSSDELPPVAANLDYLPDGSGAIIRDFHIPDIYLPLLFSAAEIDFAEWYEVFTGKVVQFARCKEFRQRGLLVGSEHQLIPLDIANLSVDEPVENSLIDLLMRAYDNGRFIIQGVSLPTDDIHRKTKATGQESLIKLNRYFADFIKTLPASFREKFSNSQALFRAIQLQWYQIYKDRQYLGSDISVAFDPESQNIVFHTAQPYAFGETAIVQQAIDAALDNYKQAASLVDRKGLRRDAFMSGILQAVYALVGEPGKLLSDIDVAPELGTPAWSEYVKLQRLCRDIVKIKKQDDDITDEQWHEFIEKLQAIYTDSLPVLREQLKASRDGEYTRDAVQALVNNVSDEVLKCLTDAVSYTPESRAKENAIRNAWRVDLTGEEQETVATGFPYIDDRCFDDPRLILVFTKKSYITESIYSNWYADFAPLEDSYPNLCVLHKGLRTYRVQALTLSNAERQVRVLALLQQIKAELKNTHLPDYMRVNHGVDSRGRCALVKVQGALKQELNYLRETQKIREEAGLMGLEFLNTERTGIYFKQEPNLQEQKAIVECFKVANKSIPNRQAIRDYAKLVANTNVTLKRVETTILHYLDGVYGIRPAPKNLEEDVNTHEWSMEDMQQCVGGARGNKTVYSSILALGIIQRFRQHHGEDGCLSALEDIEDYEAVITALHGVLERHNKQRHFFQRKKNNHFANGGSFNNYGNPDQPEVFTFEGLKAALGEKPDENSVFRGKATFSFGLGQELAEFEDKEYKLQQSQRSRLFRDSSGKYKKSVLTTTATSKDAVFDGLHKYLDGRVRVYGAARSVAELEARKAEIDVVLSPQDGAAAENVASEAEQEIADGTQKQKLTEVQRLRAAYAKRPALRDSHQMYLTFIYDLRRAGLVAMSELRDVTNKKDLEAAMKAFDAATTEAVQRIPDRLKENGQKNIEITKASVQRLYQEKTDAFGHAKLLLWKEVLEEINQHIEAINRAANIPDVEGARVEGEKFLSLIPEIANLSPEDRNAVIEQATTILAGAQTARLKVLFAEEADRMVEDTISQLGTYSHVEQFDELDGFHEGAKNSIRCLAREPSPLTTKQKITVLEASLYRLDNAVKQYKDQVQKQMLDAKEQSKKEQITSLVQNYVRALKSSGDIQALSAQLATFIWLVEQEYTGLKGEQWTKHKNEQIKVLVDTVCPAVYEHWSAEIKNCDPTLPKAHAAVYQAAMVFLDAFDLREEFQTEKDQLESDIRRLCKAQVMHKVPLLLDSVEDLARVLPTKEFQTQIASHAREFYPAESILPMGLETGAQLAVMMDLIGGDYLEKIVFPLADPDNNLRNRMVNADDLIGQLSAFQLLLPKMDTVLEHFPELNVGDRMDTICKHAWPKEIDISPAAKEEFIALTLALPTLREEMATEKTASFRETIAACSQKINASFEKADLKEASPERAAIAEATANTLISEMQENAKEAFEKAVSEFKAFDGGVTAIKEYVVEKRIALLNPVLTNQDAAPLQQGACDHLITMRFRGQFIAKFLESWITACTEKGEVARDTFNSELNNFVQKNDFSANKIGPELHKDLFAWAEGCKTVAIERAEARIKNGRAADQVRKSGRAISFRYEDYPVAAEASDARRRGSDSASSLLGGELSRPSTRRHSFAGFDSKSPGRPAQRKRAASFSEQSQTTIWSRSTGAGPIVVEVEDAAAGTGLDLGRS